MVTISLVLFSWLPGWPAWVVGLDPETLVERTGNAVVITMGEKPGTGTIVQGSGCSLTETGLILVTAHQLKGLERLRVRDFDQTEHFVTIVEVDEALDLALLRSETPLPGVATIGDATRLRMGSALLAITSPRGLDFSAVTGIVSSLDRQFKGRPAIQSDLPAGPGSSGGPVFDEDGRLIGIVEGAIEDMPGVTVVNPINNAYALLSRHGVALPDRGSPGLALAQMIPASDVGLKVRAAVQSYNLGVTSRASSEKIAAYSRSVELLPDFFEAWFNLGVIYTGLGEFGQAIESYETAQRLDGDSVAVYRNLGRLFLSSKEVDRAVGAFGRMVELMPDDASSHNDLGEAYRRWDDLVAAEREFRAALGLRPGYAQAVYNLGLTLANAQRPEEAIAEFQRYLQLEPAAEDGAQVRTWIEELGANK